MDETAVVGETLMVKVAAFMAGLTEEERALFVATLPVANPPEMAPGAEDDDTAGYNLAALTSFTAPTLAPAPLTLPTFRCWVERVSVTGDWGKPAFIYKTVCGWR